MAADPFRVRPARPRTGRTAQRRLACREARRDRLPDHRGVGDAPGPRRVPRVAPGGNPAPWEPVVVGTRLHARGAADDKGQVFFHTLGVRAHLAATGRTAPAVN